MTQSLLHGKNFYCREWVFAKLLHCLENRNSAKTSGVLVVGGPGSGKTAVFCELVWPSIERGKQSTLSKRILAYHFCQAHDIKTLSVQDFVQSLAEQLSKSHLAGPYNEKLKDIENSGAVGQEENHSAVDEVFKNSVLYPLLEIEPPNQPYILLVDSIDQSCLHNALDRGSESRSIAELLSNYHHLFPQWLLLVCSARKQNKSITRLFTGFRKISLDDLRKSHVVRDVQQYILSRLDQEEALRQHLNRETAEMLNQLHIKSNGCFIYLEKVLDGVAENFIMLREIREIPGTLNGLYLWLCQRIFVRKQFLKIQPILNVILSTRKPLTENQLYECVWTKNTHLTAEEFSKRMVLLSKLLVDDIDGAKILFHHSFAEWLLDVKHCTQKYLCHVTEGHAMIAMWYTRRAPNLSPEEVCDFALHLSKIHPSPVLQPHHLPLWLVVSGAPVEASLMESPPPNDQKVLKLLTDAGAQMPDVVREESEKESTHMNKIPDDPLEALLQSGGNINQIDSNQRTLLHTAAYDGNDKLVQRLIEKGADIETVDKNGQTALNLASRQGHLSVVEVLLKSGADPDHADCDGWTSLRSSAWAGHIDVVNSLLEKGAQVDLADSDMRTALRAAAWGGHDDIVLTLLQHGACVNQADNEGRTALIAAAYMGHSEIVEHLLDHGAEVNHEDSDGRTALSVASLCVPASEGHADVVSLLLEKGAEVDHRDKEGVTPLLVAAFEGHSEVCELLLEGEADVDHADNNGRTPIFAAASMGHPAVVSLLLFWGAAVDAIDSEGRTVLSVAASQGNPSVVRQLLDRGLDETHRDNGGWTPLHYAAYEGHEEVCEILVEAGTKVTEVDNDGRIPLILASQEGYAKLVEKLANYNRSSIDHKAHDGRTALRVAALEGHKDVVQVLLSQGADVNYKDADGRSTLYLLALDNRIEMADFLASSKADLEVTDVEGRTPLHVSSWQGHYEMVELLLNHGANVNTTDNDKRTALQSAAWQGHVNIVKLLLERSARVDHVCNQGATALCIAAQEGHMEVVSVLLQYGADPNHADQFGRNPLRVATKGGHTQVIQLLEEYMASNSNHRRQGLQSGSISTTSLTSASTAETKPCSAILYQPGLYSSPESTVDPRKSSVSNRSSSKSSSNLTTSTKSSSHRGKEMINGNAPMTFTQQLQQCSRPRHRISQILSPLSEPRSPVPSPPQSPLSDTDGTSHPVHVPLVIQPLKFEPKARIQGPESPRRSLSRTQEQNRFRRNGIVTNPNYKGMATKNSYGIEGAMNSNQFLRNKHIPCHYEVALKPSVKKETPL